MPSGPTSTCWPALPPVLFKISSVDKCPLPSVKSTISVVTLPSVMVLTTGILIRLKVNDENVFDLLHKKKCEIIEAYLYYLDDLISSLDEGLA